MEENVSPYLKKKNIYIYIYTANNPFPLPMLLIYLASIVFLAMQYFCLEKNILHKDKMLSIGQWVTKRFSSVQSISSVQLFATPWTAACQASLSITNPWSLPKLISIESVMPSNHLILCHPLLFPPSIFPSIRVFYNESALHIRWPKYWSFGFNISPSSEHSGLISVKIDWLDLLAVQGSLKCLPQHHSSKASILWCSDFFTVQFSHLYMTTEKTIAF